MAEKINLLDPKTGQIFEAADQETADKQMRAYGLQIAGAQDVQNYDEQQRSTGLVDKAKAFGGVLAGSASELAKQATKAGIGVDVANALGLEREGVLQPELLTPYAYTPQMKERVRANPGTAAAATVAADLGTALLIPELGVPGLLASATASGLLTEAGTTYILEDEYSMKDAALAAGASFALEGAGALAITGAMKAKGIAKNYLDGAVERARRVATEGAATETDAALAAEKMRRNAEELYTKHQTDLDEALAEIDARTTGAPERMFTPGALKKTVSENLAAQEEAFLDVAVKFDQAAEVADVPGIAEVKATLQDALGKTGPGMYEALRTARRQLDELGDVSSPLVKEAAEQLDKTLRSQPTWGKAAKNYADIADEAGDAADTVSVNLREANARDLLDQRLDRARRLSAITGDKKLAAQLKRAERALEEADKVTGARVLGETTPDEIAQLQKKLDGFEKRAPKLAKEIQSSHGRLNKQLGGILGEMTEDGALDYVAVRASGFGGKTDPVRDMFVKAEKRIAAMKAAGEDPTKIARATAELSSFRKTVAEVAEMPRAAQRIRDWHARPGIGGKVNQALNNVPLDEIENVLQSAMPASAATLGGVAFGIPGYIGGYLGGRLLYKRFGRKISEAAWNKAKKEIGGHALKHPGEAATGALGAFAGGVLAHGNAPGAVAGYVIGRKAGQLIGRGAKRAWGKAKRTLGEPGAPSPLGTPLGTPPKTARKAAAEARKAERAANKASKKAAAEARKAERAANKASKKAAVVDAERESFARVNKAAHEVKNAATDEARAAARKEHEAALAAHSAAEKRGFAPGTEAAPSPGAARPQKLSRALGPPPKLEPGDILSPRSTPLATDDPVMREVYAEWEKRFLGYQRRAKRTMHPHNLADMQAEHVAILARALGVPDYIEAVAKTRAAVGYDGYDLLTNYGNFGENTFANMRSYAWNQALRSGNPVHPKLAAEIGAFDKVLDEAVAKGAARPGTYYRGMVLAQDELDKLVPGAEITNPGYASMTPYRHLADQYAKPGPMSPGKTNPVIMNIRSQTGVPVGIVEVLGRRGQKYRIESVTTRDGKTIVDAVELGREKPGVGQVVVDAIKNNPSKALGLALFAGSSMSMLNEDAQTPGAAAASAGLLLLLLPRNIGRRAAFRRLEEAAATAARRVHGTELAPLRRALEESRAQSRAILRDATAPGSVDWTPAELVEMQAQHVRQVYAQGMRPGEWRAGNHSGRMSDEAQAYLRTELARMNAGWVNGDAALRRTYDQAAREADIAERAPRGDNPSPRVVRLERVGSLQPERAARLEYDAGRLMNGLDQESRTLISRVFSDAREDVHRLTRYYLDGVEPPDMGIFPPPGIMRSPDDLIGAQIDRMRVSSERLGIDGSNMSPEQATSVQRAVETELRRLNASISQQNMPRALVPEGHRADTPEARIRSLETDVELAYDRQRQQREFLRNRHNWVTGEMRQADRALADAQTEARAIFDAFLRGERYQHGDELLELGTRADVIAAQRRVARDRFASEAGIRADTVNPGFDAYADSYFTRYNAEQARDAARRLPQPGDEALRARIDETIEEMARGGESTAEWNLRRRLPNRVSDASRADELITTDDSIVERSLQAGENARNAREFKEAERQRNLKPPNPAERPARIDGIPTEAAIRLDDALEADFERLGDRWDALAGFQEARAMLREETPALEERVREFVRDNPGMVSEEDAIGYMRRRLDDFGSDNGLEWLNEGGYARYQMMPLRDDDELMDLTWEALRSQTDEVDYTDLDEVERFSVDTDRLIDFVADDLSPREQRRLREIVEEREETLNRSARADLEENYNSWRDENPDSEPPDSAPDSDEGHEVYQSGRVEYRRGAEADDGLPSNDELKAIGLTRLEVDSNAGVENTFGRALTEDEVKRIFSLEHLQKYAQANGDQSWTSLTVTSRRVAFEGSGGPNFKLEITYEPTADGVGVHYGYMKLPPDATGQGMMKTMVTDMVEPLEALGASHVEVGAAWIGKYIWPKLGLVPDSYATRQALSRYEADLVEMFGEGHPAVTMSMQKIQNLRDLADAYLPRNIMEDQIPLLKQRWEELRFQWKYHNIDLQPFEEACLRTSRSGNPQFLSGKYFLIMREGSWTSGLRLEVKPGTAWYDTFKARLGMGAGAVAAGIGLHEVVSGFQGTDMVVSGIGGEQDDSASLPPEVLSFTAKQAEKLEKVERTREKLGYLKTETEIIVRDTARAVANANPRARVVSGVPGVTHNKGVGVFLGSHSTLRAAFEDKRKTLETLQRDPMTLVDELTEGLSELQENAPELHAKMVQQTYKVIDFLHSKLPSTVGASLTRPEGSPASPLAIRQFALYYSAATDPSSVMGDLANNRAQKEQVDTLRQLWPDVYTDLKLAMVEQLSKGRPTVAQRTRMDLLFDFGDSLEKGLSPRLVAALNQHRAAQGPGGEGGAQKGGQVPSRRSQPSIGGTSATAALGYGPAAGPGTLA